MPLQCRLVTIVGWHGEYGVFWPGCVSGREHVARHDVGAVEQGARLALNAPEAAGWQEPCRDCGAADIPWEGDVKRFSSTRPVYDTEDGQTHPGDMFWTSTRTRPGAQGSGRTATAATCTSCSQTAITGMSTHAPATAR